jgi:methyl-accepting chemotaxis protein
MQGSISFNELGLIIIFLLILAASGYLIVTLKNANRLIRELAELLSANRQRLRGTLENLHQISEDGVEIGREVKKSADKAGRAIEVISQNTADTVLTLSKTADDIGTYAVIIGEIAKAVTKFILPDRK